MDILEFNKRKIWKIIIITMSKRYTKEIILEKLKIIHNNKYDYSLIVSFRMLCKVDIICPIHGIFQQRVDSHLKGMGCKKCASDNLKEKKFINKFNLIHNYKYDYSLSNYVNNKTKIKIICPKHGIFEQRPDNHLKNGCPHCRFENINNTYNTINNANIPGTLKIKGSNIDSFFRSFLDHFIILNRCEFP